MTISTEIACFYRPIVGFPGGAVVKNLPASTGDVGSILGLGRSPGEGNDKTLSIVAWKMSWTEEPGWLQSMGSQESDTT